MYLLIELSEIPLFRKISLLQVERSDQHFKPVTEGRKLPYSLPVVIFRFDQYQFSLYSLHNNNKVNILYYVKKNLYIEKSASLIPAV
jgi:hypothetical protein